MLIFMIIFAPRMNLTATILKRLLKRKLATAVLVTVSLASFATLGDGGKKDFRSSSNSEKLSSRTFSLRSGYSYRGNNQADAETDEKG